MFSIQNSANTTDVYPANPVFENNEPLEHLNGAVYVCPSRASWMMDPKKDDYISRIAMGNYHEIFKDRGEFILCLEVNVRNSQCGNWAKHSFNLPQLKGDFPRYLPISYFLDKRVDETIEIICKEKGNLFTLACGQENFEYRVEEAFMTTYHELNDKYQKGTLSPEDQQKWMIVSKIKEINYPHSTVENTNS